jgi:hypothetical protein
MTGIQDYTTHKRYFGNDAVPYFSAKENFPYADALIETEFWEAYILNRGAAAKFFAGCSHDKGPVNNDAGISSGRIRYRFTSSVWFADVKPFLIRHRIPVSLRIDKYAIK